MAKVIRLEMRIETGTARREKIYFPKQHRLLQEGIGGFDQNLGKVRSDNRAGHIEEELRQDISGQLRNVAKNDSKSEDG